MLSKRIKENRERNNLSQQKLADKLGVSQQAVAKWENGKAEPDSTMLLTLAEIFNCSVDYLLGRTDIRNPHISDEYAKKHKITKRDLVQYEDFIQHAGAFFMNDEIADEDKEKLFRDISELFWKAKEINKEKYGKKQKTKNE